MVVVLAPVIFTWFTISPGKSDADFDRLLNAGKTYYDSGEAQKAIDAFSQALQHKPTETDLLLNLANAHRLANQPAEVIKYAGEALAIDNNIGAGHFLIGCARLRLNQTTNAIQALQQAYDIDNTLARSGICSENPLAVGNFEDAALYLEEVTTYEEEHLGAAYTWPRCRRPTRRPRPHSNCTSNASPANRCRITRPPGRRASTDQNPFKLDQPSATGITVKFVDDTAFAGNATKYAGPFGVIDFNHNGINSLFVRTSTNTCTLANTNGFAAFGMEFGADNANYTKASSPTWTTTASTTC